MAKGHGRYHPFSLSPLSRLSSTELEMPAFLTYLHLHSLPCSFLSHASRSLVQRPSEPRGGLLCTPTLEAAPVPWQVIELCRPLDSRLEHVDFESLFSSLSVRHVVSVFASLLLERRVIFIADKLRYQPLPLLTIPVKS